jgi:hypothetical protein
MLRDHPQPFSLRQFAEVIALALPAPGTPFWPLAALILPVHALLLVLAWEAVRRGPWREFPLLVIYLLFAAAVPLITIPKGGSATNHLLELFAVGSVCAAVGYSRVAQQAGTKKWVVVFPILLALLTAGLAITWRLPQLNQPSTAMLADCGRAYAYVKRHPGERVLAENLGAVVLAGKPVLVSPYLLNQIVLYGGWPDEALRSQVQEQEFQVVLLSDEAKQLLREGSAAWSPSVLRAIEANYQLKARFACRYASAAYEPRPRREGSQTHSSGQQH